MAPHLALVPFTGFRVREQQMRECGMTLPGFRQRAAAIAELPALGLLTVAGATPDPWTCSYHPAPGVNESLIAEIVARRPTLVAVSALTASIREAYQLCQQLREYQLPTVIGGLHATVCPGEAGQFCDAVVIGSAEPVWRRVLDDALAGRLAPRYESNRNVHFQWAMPRYDLLASGSARHTLQTQRGCPLACEFCGASRLLGRFREKPFELIRSELKAICAISAQPLIELADDNTFAGQRDFNLVFDLLQQCGARWFTESDWSIGERPEILARLAESGCRQVLVGIESLVFRYPGQGRKQAELNRIMDAVQAIQESGVVVNGCFIVGAEGETLASLERLADFILNSCLAEVQITIQTPFPGTGLYERLRQQGRLLPYRDWSDYTLFDVTYQPDRLTVQQLETAFRSLLRNIYSAEATGRRAELRRRIWRTARKRPR